jgi:hypothetical protein
MFEKRSLKYRKKGQEMYGKLLQVALNYLFNAFLTSLEEDVCHSALRSSHIRNEIFNLQDAVCAYRSLHRLYGPNC